MRGDEHGAALGAQLAEEHFELLDGVRVEADQRLVEDEHARAVHQGAADGELLLHALGELAAQLFALVVELQALEQGVAVAVVLHAVGAADEFEVLLHGQQLVDRGQLGYVSQLALGGQGLVGLAADEDFAGKAQQARDALDYGGFARAVRPEQDCRLPRVHGKADVGVGYGLAVLFGDVFDAQQLIGHRLVLLNCTMWDYTLWFSTTQQVLRRHGNFRVIYS